MTRKPDPQILTGFPKEGLPPAQLTEALENMRRQDVDWKSGRAWSLVYSAGTAHDQVLHDAYTRYSAENGLSPAAFPSLARMEREVVWAVMDLVGGNPHLGGGTMTSGGTESIICAIKAYRDSSPIPNPSIVIPSTAHPAFMKAGALLQVEVRVVPVDANLTADVSAMKGGIDHTTVALVASAPAFPYGLVDPIVSLGAVASEAGIGLHIDASLGGFALPFVSQIRGGVPPFDFHVPGVTSMNVDIHKYGYGPKGSSTVLYADKDLRRAQFTAYADWPGGALVSPTLLGTRPGGAIAAAWAGLHHLGRDGYHSIFAGVMHTVTQLQDGIAAIGDLTVIGDPPMSVFAFTSESKDIFAVADLLEAEGWRIDRQSDPDCLHLIVNPTHAAVTADFLTALEGAYEAAPALDSVPRRQVVYGVSSHVPRGEDITRILLDDVERRYDEAVAEPVDGSRGTIRRP